MPMQFYRGAILILLALTGCGSPKTTESLSDDSPDSTALTGNTRAEEMENDTPFGNAVDSYLADNVTDTAAFQLISGTCAIITAETEKQAAEREKREREAFLENEKIARQAWDSQPHDSTETFEYAPGYEGDGYSYLEKTKEMLTKLNIPLITAQPKDYVRIKKSNGKFYTVNVRNELIVPQWTIILFHVDKSPIVIDAMDMTEEPVRQYFSK